MKIKKIRKHRTIEERIAEKEAELEAIRSRQRLVELRENEGIKNLVAAVRAIDRAGVAAENRGNAVLQQALAVGREPLAAYLAGEGIQIPTKRRLEVDGAA